LPLQANYYPIPAAAYIEDKSTRLTMLTSSPLGCSSLSSGKLEVMLDRRLNQDDNLGVGQGVLDNHPTKHIFRILVEKRNSGCQVSSFYYVYISRSSTRKVYLQPSNQISGPERFCLSFQLSQFSISKNIQIDWEKEF